MGTWSGLDCFQQNFFPSSSTEKIAWGVGAEKQPQTIEVEWRWVSGKCEYLSPTLKSAGKKLKKNTSHRVDSHRRVSCKESLGLPFPHHVTLQRRGFGPNTIHSVRNDDICLPQWHLLLDIFCLSLQLNEHLASMRKLMWLKKNLVGCRARNGEGTGNPLQYSCLENPMDRGALWATVHGVAKSRTRLSDFTHSRELESPRSKIQGENKC